MKFYREYFVAAFCVCVFQRVSSDLNFKLEYVRDSRAQNVFIRAPVWHSKQ